MSKDKLKVSGSFSASLDMQNWGCQMPSNGVQVSISSDVLLLFSDVQNGVRMDIAHLDIADQPIEIVDAKTGEILFANKLLKEIRPYEPHQACFNVNAGGERCELCPLGQKIMSEIRAKTLITLGDRLYEVSHLPVHYNGKEAFIQYYYDKTEEETQRRIRESVTEDTSAGFLIVDLDFRLTFANDTLVHMTGFSQEELSKMTLFDIAASEKSKKILAEQKLQRDNSTKRTYSLKLRRKDGEFIYTKINATTAYSVNGKIIGSYALIIDITKERETTKQLQAAIEKGEELNAKHEHLFENMNGAMIVIEGSRIIKANSKFYEILGHKKEEVDGIDIQDLDKCFTDEKKREIFRAMMRKTLRKGSMIEEAQIQPEGKDLVDIEASISHVKHGNKRLTYVIIQDITKRKELEKRLEQLATTDGLTGIPNRRTLDETLNVEFNRAQRNGEPLACLMIDADKFKEINDLLSHSDGDTALQRIAKCLAESVRTAAGDFVARYGGEEFCILLPNCDQGEAIETANRIRNAVKKMRLEHPTRGVVSISVGIAMISKKMADSNQLIKTADAALYKAKENGRDRVEVAEFEKTKLL